MKLLLSSAILAQILSSSATPVAGEEKRFLLNKQRRAAGGRRSGKQLFSTFVSNRNLAESPLEVKPLRNAHQELFDRVSFPRVKSSSNENNKIAEADVGLLAYESPGSGDVGFEGEDPGTNRRLQSFCDYLASYGGYECDCSQVDETTYMGTASCTYKTEETCYCRDKDSTKPICYSVTQTIALEGNISLGGRYTLGEEFCLTFDETYLDDSPVPPLCINYSYDEYGMVAEECTMMLGGTVCNSCATSPSDNGACFNFDCENLGSSATGSKVGSTCPGMVEWPLVTAEVFLQNEWDNVTDMCPAEDSGPGGDSTPTGDGTPAPSGDDTPGTADSAVLHTSSSLSAVGGAMAVIVWLFAVGM